MYISNCVVLYLSKLIIYMYVHFIYKLCSSQIKRNHKDFRYTSKMAISSPLGLEYKLGKKHKTKAEQQKSQLRMCWNFLPWN